MKTTFREASPTTPSCSIRRPARIDTITDFESESDEIEISGAGFGGLVAGQSISLLNAANLDGSVSASDSLFVFDMAGEGAGDFCWDADGGSAADAAQSAHFGGVAMLQASDFVVVA